jgi:hypothetical protein
MICSFEFLARFVRTRIPSEQTFSVVVRSAAVGFCGLVISTGIASRTRFSSRPDFAAISATTFHAGFSWLAPGWGSAEELQEPTRSSATMILGEMRTQPVHGAHLRLQSRIRLLSFLFI